MLDQTNGETYHVKTFLLYGKLHDDGAIHVGPPHQEFAECLERYLNQEKRRRLPSAVLVRRERDRELYRGDNNH